MTYSIVARDEASGELGVAVQSHYFGSGSRVPWAEAGVGVVATQAFVQVSYGPQGLERIAAGAPASEALAALVEADAAPALRQVAMLDAVGRVAVHTGVACVPAAAHRCGPGYSVQGNMLRSEAVLDAMSEAYRGASGDLAERLLAALQAGELEGGDLRGRRSAALVVVGARRTEEEGGDRIIDLRADDATDPLAELTRLLGIRRAGLSLERAIAAVAGGRVEEARLAFRDAQRRHPENLEYSFWAGVGLAHVGCIEEAREWLAAAFQTDAAWREMARRLPGVGLLPKDAKLLEQLGVEPEGAGASEGAKASPRKRD